MLKPKTWYQFFYAVQGNWRNSIFIECSTCPYGQPLCGGYLLAMDSEGQPLLVSTETLLKLSGEDIQKDECRSIWKASDFESLYALWLTWQTDSSKECALLQLFQKQEGTELSQ